MQNKIFCDREGHDQEIIGLCLFDQCSITTSTFCTKCISSNPDYLHQEHPMYCLEFEYIANVLLSYTETLASEKQDFEKCHTLLTGFQEQISQIFTSSQKVPKKKILNIISKLQMIHLKLSPQSNEFDSIIAQLRKQDFDFTEAKIFGLKKSYCSELRKKKLFERILKALIQSSQNYKQLQIVQELQSLLLQQSQIHFERGKMIQDKVGESLIKLGMREITLREAIQEFDSSILKNKKQIQAYYSKAKALFELKQLEEAKTCLDQAIQIEPNFFEAWLLKGKFLMESENYDEAIECLNQSIQISQDRQKKATIIPEQGEQESEKIIRFCDQYIHLKPEDQYGYNLKAKMLCELNEVDKAIQCIEQFNLLKSNEFSGYFYISDLLFQYKEYEKAIQCMEICISKKPDDQTRYWHLSQILQYLIAKMLVEIHQYGKAAQCWDKYIREKPNNQLGYYQKADILCKLKQYDQVIECFDLYIRQSPSDLSRYSMKANFLYKLEEFDKAIKPWDYYIERNPDDFSCLLQKADMLLKLGQFIKAIQCWDQYILLNSNNDSCYSFKTNICKRHHFQLYRIAIQCERISQGRYLGIFGTTQHQQIAQFV